MIKVWIVYCWAGDACCPIPTGVFFQETHAISYEAFLHTKQSNLGTCVKDKEVNREQLYKLTEIL